MRRSGRGTPGPHVSHGGHFTFVGEGLAILVNARSNLLDSGIAFLLHVTLFVAVAILDHGLSVAAAGFTACSFFFRKLFASFEGLSSRFSLSAVDHLDH